MNKAIYVCFGILAVGVLTSNLMMLGVVLHYENAVDKYEDTIDRLITKDVKVELHVEFLNGTACTYPIALQKSPEIVIDQETSSIESQEYSYLLSDIDLKADFRFIDLIITLHSNVLEKYSITVNWFIEDSTGNINNGDFLPDTVIINHVSAKEDITRFMWKEDVPDKIAVEITLA